MLECWEDDELPPHATLGEVPFFENITWLSATPIPRGQIPSPLKLVVGGAPGDMIPPIMDEGIPLWREDVIAAMVRAGVEDFELFDVELTDSRDGTILRNYKAVNVL